MMHQILRIIYKQNLVSCHASGTPAASVETKLYSDGVGCYQLDDYESFLKRTLWMRWLIMPESHDCLIEKYETNEINL